MRTLTLPLAVSAALSLSAVSVPAQFGISLTNGGKVDPHIAIKNHYTLVPQTGMTIEAWITYDGSTLGTGYRWPTIIRQNPVAGSESYFLRVNASNNKSPNLSFAVKTNQNGGLDWATYTFKAGDFKNWTHVAATWDPSTKAQRVYINGVLKASNTTFGNTLINSGGETRIGVGNISAGAGLETWNGQLDEVRLWPFARTANEIKATMNMALKNVPGAVSTWNFDLVPADGSGNNHGKNVNSPTYTKINGLKLTLVTDMGAKKFGLGNYGCNGLPEAGVTNYVNLGNKDFAFTCTNTVISSNHVGALWIGIAKLTKPLNFNGAALWVDLSQPGLLLFIKANAHGLFRMPLTIPATGIPVGTKVYCQYLWDEPTCIKSPVTSIGLELTIKK